LLAAVVQIQLSVQDASMYRNAHGEMQ